MAPRFYLQSGYKGKETASIVYSYDREDYSYSARHEYQKGQIPVGSVEFVEQYIGIRIPNYFPEFLDNYLHREVRWIEGLYSIEDEDCFFAKPADRHKRFEARIIFGYDKYEPNFYSWQNGPYWISDITFFVDEWRYYVANGKVLAAYWYDGRDKEEVEAPSLNINWPKDFCGAVDFGRMSDGKIALVENNLPYGCGWYGSYGDGKVYGEWLEAGFEFLKIKENKVRKCAPELYDAMVRGGLIKRD